MSTTETTTTTIVQRTQQVVEQIQNPVFLEQLSELLPEGVTVDRFKRVAITAVRANPDLAGASDQNSLFASLIRCAQDGLLPDGKQAALVIYGGKVGYLPMIGGIRSIAAVYGWTIRTQVVYANDEFEYTEEPPEILHRPVRPGMERGDLIAAYAVATHRDGRRVQTVLHPADIAKRRGKAQTTKVWEEFPAPMWEKSAGHDIFGQLSLDPADARVARMLSAELDPATALYGPNGATFTASEIPLADGIGTGESQQAETAAPPAAVSVPGEAVEEADWSAIDANAGEAPSDDAVAAAGAVQVPGGVHQGKPLSALAESPEGQQWMLTGLKRLVAEDPTRQAIEVYVRAMLPEVWSKFETWRAEQ